MLTESVSPNWSVTPTPGLQINSTAISGDGSQLITGTSAEYGSSDSFAIYSYKTDGQTVTEQWSDGLGTDVTQGVFWVAISGDGSQAAAGGEYGSGQGFLRTYNVALGLASKQEFDYSGRINEVEMDAFGVQIVAVEEGNIHYYTLSDSVYSEQVTTVPNAYLRSCGISDDGSWVVVGGEVSTTGLFSIYQGVGGQLTLQGSFQASSGILRVVVSRDGQYFAASTKSGEVLCFALPVSSNATLTPLWTYTATDYSIGYSYALAICHTAQGDLYVGVGGNNTGSTEADTTPGYGFSYMLKSVQGPVSGDYSAQRLWIYQLQYCPNPGMNMDAAGVYVTSADGEPIFSATESETSTQETPGNFYLFNAQTGELYWQYATSVMNWPMAINAAGTAVFAASDNGSAYYWGSPSTLGCEAG